MLKNGRVAARLPAQDLKRARAFYAEKLGLEPARREGGRPALRLRQWRVRPGAPLSVLGRETRSVSTSTCSGQGPNRPTYARRLDVPTLAREAMQSTAHFSLSFKRALGETPHQYLRRRGTGDRGGARELSNNDRSKEER
jgi:AraC-like DNA-binding protein